MPIYSFHCQNCDHRFDSLMRPYDPVECPKCKARETAGKILSGTFTLAVTFNGETKH